MACHWLIDNSRCNEPTNALVCRVCLPEKQRLYKKYKSAESKVIYALDNDVSDNPNELMKVITRLQHVIDLRKEFTSKLHPSARDYGHELRVRILYNKVNEYKAKLHDLHIMQIPENISVDNNECEPAVNIITCITEVKSIVKQIEEDPFTEFEADIINNKMYEELLNEFKDTMVHNTRFNDAQMNIMYYYIMHLFKFVNVSFRRINLLLRGSVHKYTFPVNNKVDMWAEASVFLHHFVSTEFSSTANALSWLRYIIPLLSSVNTFDAKIDLIDGKYLLVINHLCKSGKANRSLGVYWLGKDKYRYEVLG